MIWVRFPFVHLTAQFFLNNLFCLFRFLWFLTFFFIDFDGYYYVRTDEGQPRPKYIFNKCGTNNYFIFLCRGFVRHHSPNFIFLYDAFDYNIFPCLNFSNIFSTYTFFRVFTKFYENQNIWRQLFHILNIYKPSPRSCELPQKKRDRFVYKPFGR